MEDATKSKLKLASKIALWVGISLIIIALALEILLYFFATAIFEKPLNNFVEKESKGVYHVKFEDLSLELFTGYIQIKNLQLIPDSANYEKLKKTNKKISSLYNISLKSLTLKGLSPIRILMDKELVINKLDIQKPTFKILQTNKAVSNDVSKITIIKSDLYQLISPYFKTAQVNIFNLEDGVFNMKSINNKFMRQTGAERISFFIKDFLVNEEAYKKQENLFYSKKIKLNIYKYHLNFKDKLHKLLIDEIALEPTDSVILIKNAKLITLPNSLTKDSVETKLNIDAKLLKINGIDIYKAWLNKEVKLKNILLDEPNINLTVNTLTRKKEKPKLNIEKIYQLINKQIKSLAFDSLNIKKASFALYEKNKKRPTYKIDKLNATLSEFLLDSTAIARQNTILFSKDLMLDINGLQLPIMKQSHRLKAGKLYASLSKRSLIVKGLEIMPTNKPNSTRLNINCKQIKLTRLNYLNAIKKGYIYTSEISVNQADMDIAKDISQSPKRKSPPKVLNKINYLRVNKINIANSKIKFRQTAQDTLKTFLASNFNISVNKIVINKNDFSNPKDIALLLSKDFKLNLKNFAFQTHKNPNNVKIDSLYLSSSDSLLFVNKLKFFHDNQKSKINLLKQYSKTTIFNLSAENLWVMGLELQNAITKNKYKANKIILKDLKLDAEKYPQLADFRKMKKAKELEFTIKNNTVLIPVNALAGKPASTIKEYEDSIKNAFTPIEIKVLKLQNSFLLYAQKDTTSKLQKATEATINTSIRDIYITKEILANKEFPLEKIINLSISKLKHISTKKNINIKASLVNFTPSDSSLHLENLRIQPLNRKKIIPSKPVFYIMASVIDANNISAENFMKNQKLQLANLNIPKLFLDVELPQKSKRKRKQKKHIFTLPNTLKLLGIETVNVNKGYLALKSFKGEKILIRTKFSFKARQMQYDKKMQHIPLSYKKASLAVNKFFYTTPDMTKKLKIDSAYLSLNKQKLYSQNLTLNISAPNPIAINSKVLNISSFNLINILFKKRFYSQRVDIKTPNLRYSKVIKNENPASLDSITNRFYTMIDKKFKSFDIRKLNIRNGKVQYIDKTNPQSDKIKLQSIYLHADNISLKNRHKVLLSDSISAYLKNFKKRLPSNLYDLSIKEIGINIPRNYIYIHKGKLKPRYSKYKFAHKATSLKTRLNISNIDAQIHNINLHDLVARKGLKADSINVAGIKLHAFSNRMLPEDTLKRPKRFMQILRELPTEIAIKKASIQDANIDFEMSAKKSRKTGSISLTDFNGYITNITNIDSLIALDNQLNARIEAKIQDDAKMTLNYDFSLASSKEYRLYGNVEPFNLKNLNTFTKNTIQIAIKEGFANQIDFNINVFENHAEGNMNFLYSNLKINILDSATAKRQFLSAVSNAILPGDNPKNKYSFPVKGKIYAKVAPHQGEMSLWTESAINGILTSMSIDLDEVNYGKQLLKKVKKLLRIKE